MGTAKAASDNLQAPFQCVMYPMFALLSLKASGLGPRISRIGFKCPTGYRQSHASKMKGCASPKYANKVQTQKVANEENKHAISNTKHLKQ